MATVTGDNRDERNKDIRVIADLNMRVSKSQSVSQLREYKQILEMLQNKWTGLDSYVTKVVALALRSADKKINRLVEMRQKRNRVQAIRMKTAHEIESLITDGTLSNMRLEIEQLKATVKQQRQEAKWISADATPKQTEAALKEYDEMQNARSIEDARVAAQADEAVKLIASYSNQTGETVKFSSVDTGKNKLDTDIDTFMKEL